MSQKTALFISTIGVLARNEYLSREKGILPSVAIAQGALESGWNLEARALFGIKGFGFVSTTSEYYTDHYETIEDSFRQYPNVSSAVVGYYDFLRDTPRYELALNNSDYKDAVHKLIYTLDGAPYATDPFYISKIISIIEDYNLTEWDYIEPVHQVVEVVLEPIIEEVAPEPPEPLRTYVIQWGDCLSIIAQDFDVDMSVLQDLNGIIDPDKIYAGDTLLIPNKEV